MLREKQKQTDRLKILEKVYESIEQRMTTNSVAVYVQLARQYGKKYQIEGLVESWILEGRNVFFTPESAKAWADTLP
ncbi:MULTISPECIES: hypothetical protein [Nostoc]|uniref:CopG family transcriptional regulator n=1 Tax=Nostoc paludosum FACHB-159 TaxID=2692908 RepID=A0ABR8KGL1_9NOSO|nr:MULTISPECIES: hypothetical protein [Nostoc]MBD2681539.1 hypothetical protein [Nostoc sp. FACHB-857]MBD2737999.1 hypothetical protein [Nostoc paludosum FACHB-159]